ncbi:hypothetical protein [Cyclobacterium jeungdonense]|uniref:Uncharacterized protein n=1 Tax=Cyclobacterium jeungdonense TaxID=708087 RepID=A0ABT8CD47_9BACT|nr:hypothetical protein [Cyclobacterium jeungdonense]MDN3689611.1 hypothetical protein [Cyclobacterium jeungdonense]
MRSQLGDIWVTVGYTSKGDVAEITPVGYGEKHFLAVAVKTISNYSNQFSLRSWKRYLQKENGRVR